MGVTKQSFNYLMSLYNKIKFSSICELGDQQFMSCPPFPENSYTRDFYESNNINYICIDTNGRGKSLDIDLNGSFYLNKTFNIITNIGTLEHVENYYSGLKHMHEMCDIGGFMIHISPAINHWPEHGFNYVLPEFFTKLAQECNYKLVDVRVEPTAIGGSDADQTYAIMQKLLESKFPKIEELYKFEGLKVISWNDSQYNNLKNHIGKYIKVEKKYISVLVEENNDSNCA
jgi:hypothetical protein